MCVHNYAPPPTDLRQVRLEEQRGGRVYEGQQREEGDPRGGCPAWEDLGEGVHLILFWGMDGGMIASVRAGCWWWVQSVLAAGGGWRILDKGQAASKAGRQAAVPESSPSYLEPPLEDPPEHGDQAQPEVEREEGDQANQAPRLFPQHLAMGPCRAAAEPPR